MEEPKYGGVFRVGYRRDVPAAFDNMWTSSGNLGVVVSALWGDNNLVTQCLDDLMAVCPFLAES
jgi:hypothetical protein